MDASPDPYAGVIAGRGDAFYADADALRRAVITRGCANPIHLPSMVKVDLFVAGGTSLDEQQIARRLRVDPGGGRELQAAFEHFSDVPPAILAAAANFRALVVISITCIDAPVLDVVELLNRAISEAG